MYVDQSQSTHHKVWLDIAQQKNIFLVIPNEAIGPDRIRGELSSTEEAVNHWINRNKCDTTPIIFDIANSVLGVLSVLTGTGVTFILSHLTKKYHDSRLSGELRRIT